MSTIPNPKFEMYRSGSQYRFRLKARNGEIILVSESYTTKQGCENGIASVKKNAPDESNFEQRRSKNDQYYFVLKAKNHEIIGTS